MFLCPKRLPNFGREIQTFHCEIKSKTLLRNFDSSRFDREVAAETTFLTRPELNVCPLGTLALSTRFDGHFKMNGSRYSKRNLVNA